MIDRAGRHRPRAKLQVMALLCIASLVVLVFAFGTSRFGVAMSGQAQFMLIVLGGFLMTCTVGPVSAVVIDVIHPGIRATGASVLALFQNLFGLAAGPFIAGILSDAWTLEQALTAMPLFAMLAAWAFVRASRSYEADLQRIGEAVREEAAATPSTPGTAPA